MSNIDKEKTGCCGIEGCDCHDHDHEVYNVIPLVFETEDGEEIEEDFELLYSFEAEHNGTIKEYAALIPDTDSEEDRTRFFVEEFEIFEYKEVGEEFELSVIEDDEEFKAVEKIYWDIEIEEESGITPRKIALELGIEI